jgi:hypothetical protein
VDWATRRTGDRERLRDDRIDTAALHIITCDDGYSPRLNLFDVIHRVRKFRDTDLNDSGWLETELVHETSNGRTITPTVTNVKVRVDGDESGGRGFLAPRSDGHGDRQRVVTADCDKESGAVRSSANGGDCAGFVAVRIHDVPEVGSFQ